MQTIPIKDVPNQSLNVTLGGQSCQINLRVTLFGLFVDLYANNALVAGGVVAQNLNPIVRSPSSGFLGDLVFIDSQGSSDPTSPGLGTRWDLVYLSASDLT